MIGRVATWVAASVVFAGGLCMSATFRHPAVVVDAELVDRQQAIDAYLAEPPEAGRRQIEMMLRSRR